LSISSVTAPRRPSDHGARHAPRRAPSTRSRRPSARRVCRASRRSSRCAPIARARSPVRTDGRGALRRRARGRVTSHQTIYTEVNEADINKDDGGGLDAVAPQGHGAVAPHRRGAVAPQGRGDAARHGRDDAAHQGRARDAVARHGREYRRSTRPFSVAAVGDRASARAGSPFFGRVGSRPMWLGGGAIGCAFSARRAGHALSSALGTARVPRRSACWYGLEALASVLVFAPC